MDDRSKLFYESIEGGSTPDEVLRYRHSSLEAKAYGVIARPGAERAWTVVFRYQRANLQFRRAIPHYESYIKKPGRAVSMNSDGTSIRVEHEDISFKSVGKLTSVVSKN